MKNNKVVRGILIGVLILLIIFGFYVIYLKFIDVKSNNNLDDMSNSDSDNNQDIRINIESIIARELNYLLPIDNIDELTNQKKLQSILYIYNNDYGYNDEVSVSELDEVFNNSCLKKLGLEYEDIYSSKMFNDMDDVLYKLNDNIYKRVNEYNLNNRLGIIYRNIIDYKQDDNIIVISYKYGFYVKEEDNLVNIFISYEDAISNSNIIKTFNIEDYKSDTSDGYAETINEAMLFDYSIYLEEMKTYTYTFNIENDDINLIGYEVN